MSLSLKELNQFLLKNKRNWIAYFASEPDFPFERYLFEIDSFLCLLNLGITENGFVIFVIDQLDFGFRRRKKDFSELIKFTKSLGKNKSVDPIELQSEFSLDDFKESLTRKDRKLKVGVVMTLLIDMTIEEYFSFKQRRSLENSI